jgi:hypothetical protein
VKTLISSQKFRDISRNFVIFRDTKFREIKKLFREILNKYFAKFREISSTTLAESPIFFFSINANGENCTDTNILKNCCRKKISDIYAQRWLTEFSKPVLDARINDANSILKCLRSRPVTLV